MSLELDRGIIPSLTELARKDWDGFVDVMARTITGRNETAFAKERMREAANQSDYLLQSEAFAGSDIREAAVALRVPTLLFAVRSSSWSFDQESAARTLAAVIPDSRLALFDDIGAGMAAEEGQTPPNILSLEAFLAELDSHSALEPPLQGPPRGALSSREIDVLRLIVAGRSSREIGEALVLSVRTVERHIANIYLKTDTHGRAQVTVYALQRGIT